MSRPDTVPAIVREYYRASFKLGTYDVNSCMLGKIRCPFVLAPDAIPGDFSDPITVERMMAAFQRFSQVEAVILTSVTGLGLITPTKFLLYNPVSRSISLEWERDPPVYPPSFIEIGYERTILVTPRVFQPVTKVLYNPDKHQMYAMGAWRDFPHRQRPVLCSDIRYYHELVKSGKDIVVLVDGVGPVFENVK